MDTFFSVSVIIPTLNSAKTLSLCLDSISSQTYPKERLEVIFADGGSQDATLKVIDEFKNREDGIKVKIVENKLRTGESGKAVALKVASGAIIAFIDSDNILDGKDWLKTMVKPFADKEIIAAEPIRYTYRKTDGYITRYCALMGMNDPLCYFLGNYDRECILSRTWTKMPYRILEDRGTYIKLRLDPQRLPTIGANGFFVRKAELDKFGGRDYLFDIDLLGEALSQDPDKIFVKVKIGIIHLFSGTVNGFCIKQARRIKDYRYFNSNNMRSYRWNKFNGLGLAYFCLCCLTMVPLLYQSLKGWLRSQDRCFLLHSVFCLATFYIYGINTLFSRSAMMERRGWQL